MALNEPRPEDLDDLLDLAAAGLRRHTDTGWVAVAPGALAGALAAVRPSHPVRGRHDAGEFLVAGDVLRRRVRALLDADPRVRARRVLVRTHDDDTLAEVVLELSAAYLEPLEPLAQAVRVAVAARLRADLGDPDLPDSVVRVDLVVVDVHRPRPPA